MKFTADAKTAAELKRIVKALVGTAVQLEVNAAGSCVLTADTQPKGVEVGKAIAEFEVADYESGVVTFPTMPFWQALSKGKALSVDGNRVNGYVLKPLGPIDFPVWKPGHGACGLDKFALAEFAFWLSSVPRKDDPRHSIAGVWFEMRPADESIYGYGTNGKIACYSTAPAAYNTAAKKKFRFLPDPVVSLMCRAGDVFMLDSEIPTGHEPKEKEPKPKKGEEVIPHDSYQVSFSLGGVDVSVFLYTHLRRVKLEQIIPTYHNMSAEVTFSEVATESVAKAPRRKYKDANVTFDFMPVSGGLCVAGLHLDEGYSDNEPAFDVALHLDASGVQVPEHTPEGVPVNMCVAAPVLSTALDGLLPSGFGTVTLKTICAFPHTDVYGVVVAESSHRSAVTMPLLVRSPGREAFYGLCKEVLFWLVDGNNPDMTEDALTDKDGVVKAINIMWPAAHKERKRRETGVALPTGYPVDWADFVRRVLPGIRVEARKKVVA